ncbi:hypothetical protein E2C01_064089 [Portunus trituberculatus]|uniref:Uncharacterized protein n=1 Tax=Portunus trituberculatus TaxID=210409 RepID=A0A5B7HKS9_PORTR|nr:hypothetical protein [Portunus trituberculatus]
MFPLSPCDRGGGQRDKASHLLGSLGSQVAAAAAAAVRGQGIKGVNLP